MLDTATKKRIDDCRDILVGKLPDPKAQIEQITIGLIYKFMDDMDKDAIELGGKAKFFSNFTIPDPEFPNDPDKRKVVDFEKYSWDSLFDAKVTASEMLKLYSEAILSMDKNPNIPQLFRDIFKNAYLPYRDPETLRMFLKTISEFEYTHSEKLGDAFEYLLSVMGSQGDAGQFRTPRHIIDFLVAVVNPRKTDTILDPACGTAGFLISAFKHIMGGGGNGDGDVGGGRGRDAMHRVSTDDRISPDNRVSSDNYISTINRVSTIDNTTITPDERKRIIGNITGYDISPDMVRLSLVNLYLHGFPDPHISEYDTLSSEERWDENFDVILANPPFMSPKGGIRPHKRFTISSNRSEVLFVDYIAEHLNPKGRAGIIVPEGVIFQSGSAYKELRKMLVENYLYAVVSLPAGIFNPYSGVKTSILLMDKEISKKSNEILFVKVANDGFNLGAQRNAVKGGQLDDAIEIIREFTSQFNGCIAPKKIDAESPQIMGAESPQIMGAGSPVETQCIASLPSPPPSHHPTTTPTTKPNYSDIAHAVPKSEIAKNGDYNLSGDRFKEKIHINSDYPLLDFEESIDKIVYSNKIKSSDYLDLGKFPIIDQSDNYIAGYWNNDEDLFKIKKPVIAFGDHTRCFKYIDFDFVLGADGVKILQPSENFIPKFFYYLIRNINIKNLGYSRHYKELKNKKIPLPPLSIQQEIVAEIDGYQKIIDGAKMVVENYKPKIDIDAEWEMVELGEITNSFQYGSNKKSLLTGNIPCLRMGNIQNGEIDWDDLKYAPEDEEFEKYLLEENDVLFNRTNSPIHVGKTGLFRGGREAVFAGYLIRIRYKKEKITGQYLNYCLNTREAKDFCQKVKTDGINQSNINAKILGTFRIPLPPLETQHQIVAQIEKEQELVNANKQLIEIFEQKIKDRIAKVWGV
jgi:type I restriction enzyme M protein